jgi:hypothetical protein
MCQAPAFAAALGKAAAWAASAGTAARQWRTAYGGLAEPLRQRRKFVLKLLLLLLHTRPCRYSPLILPG